MIVEERIYTLHPGKAPEFLKLYEEEGLAIQTPILGNLVGYFSTDIGPLNQVIHMWGFKDHAERDSRRAAMMGDPAWQAFVKKIRPLIVTQENKILIPAPFSPIR